MTSGKLYNEWSISTDISPWELTNFNGVYKTPIAQFNNYNLNHICIELNELNKFNYVNDNIVNGYITYLQYFIKDNYLYIMFGDIDPTNCNLKLQLAQLDSESVTLSGSDLLLLVVDSRTTNSTYVNSGSGELLTECFKSKAPYVRVYALDPALGSVTIYNSGVARYYLFSVASSSGGGGGTIDNIQVNGVDGTVTDKIASVNIDALIADAQNEVYGNYDDGSGSRVLKPLATKEWVQNNPVTDNNKLDSSSAATPFNTTDTYNVGVYVSYQGEIYKCIAQHTGAWNDNDFTKEVLTQPDATIQLNDQTNELSIVGADGTVLWSSNSISRYQLITSSGTSIRATSNSAIGINASNSSTTTYTISLPSILNGKINDFIIDVYAGGSGDVALTFSNINTNYKVLLKSGVDLATINTVASGSYARFSITQSPLSISNLPVYIIGRLDLDLYVPTP